MTFASAILPKLTTMQLHVYNLIASARRGLAQFEITDITGDSSYRKRVPELAKMGLIVATDHSVVVTPKGRWVRRWRLAGTPEVAVAA